MTRLLVIDGYDESGKIALENSGATSAGVLYRKMLAEFVPQEQIDIAEISLEEPASINIEAYDGACWTGSNLFFSAQNHVVQRHIELCQSFFAAGIPQFGSCWAAQVAAQATGGDVTANPKGREFGIARKIGLTDAGRHHPMYKDKPAIFDSFTSHADHITKLPEGATLLAGNTFSPVQALSVNFSKGEFWAVQYHPEYDFSEIGALAVARQDELIEQGNFKTRDAVKSYIADLQALNNDSTRDDIAWKFGIESDLRDFTTRTLEVKNWLSHFFNN